MVGCSAGRRTGRARLAQWCGPGEGRAAMAHAGFGRCAGDSERARKLGDAQGCVPARTARLFVAQGRGARHGDRQLGLPMRKASWPRAHSPWHSMFTSNVRPLRARLSSLVSHGRRWRAIIGFRLKCYRHCWASCCALLSSTCAEGVHHYRCLRGNDNTNKQCLSLGMQCNLARS